MALELKDAAYAITLSGDVLENTGLNGWVYTKEYARANDVEIKNAIPAILVTTPREALQAAWDLAYEVDEIPPSTPFVGKSDLGITTMGNAGNCFAIVANSSGAERRLIAPPAPEPWETALVPAEIPEAGE